MNSSRVFLSGSTRRPHPRSVLMGSTDPAEQISVLVIVRRRAEPPPLHAGSLVRRRAEYVAAHGARPADFEAVSRFAAAHNLRTANQHVGARSMEITGSARDMNQAFGVTLARVQIEGREHRTHGEPVSLPAELAGIVVAVLGLDNRPAGRPHLCARDAASATAPPLPVTEVASLYSFPSGVDGSGQTIALIELEGTFQASDLGTYFAGLNMAVPQVTPVRIDNSAPAFAGSLSDMEVTLDIQVAGAVAPGARIVVYQSQNTDSSFLKAIQSAVHSEPAPAAISISWGNPESDFSGQAHEQFDAAMLDAASLGIPVCVASGDHGSCDGTDNLTVDFPAAAPHALGCGGSSLQAAGGTIAGEVVWNDGNGWATGGGYSAFFPMPDYQIEAGVPAAPGFAPSRGVPDVAGHADMANGYDIFFKGAATHVGGTSAVAPLWAGLIARLAQKLGRPVGFLNPLLYAHGQCCRAITQGNNNSTLTSGGWNAGPGWNPCTGWGSPQGGALLQALSGNQE